VSAVKTYRKVHEITEQEWLDALTATPQKTQDLFVSLGGGPQDRDFPRLSYLTRRLRRKGYPIKSLPGNVPGAGLWIERP
jgi:hypothetical protein